LSRSSPAVRLIRGREDSKKPRHDAAVASDRHIARAQDVIEGTTAIEQRGHGLRVGFQFCGGLFGLAAGQVNVAVGNPDAEVVLAEAERDRCGESLRGSVVKQCVEGQSRQTHDDREPTLIVTVRVCGKNGLFQGRCVNPTLDMNLA
jgi:hypothetical protein